MRAKKLTDLVNRHDRVAVSNITGREARKVSEISQYYGSIIVGGWALGKGGDKIPLDRSHAIPVFADYQDMIETLPEKQHPNKIIIYSPPEAVYGEVKNVVNYPSAIQINTIFIITEHVSVEVAAKIKSICESKGIDVIGCNTLGIINTEDHVRIGAVGGDQPEETFRPGSATLISNSGNMVNTIASYLYDAGIGVRFGISTGKDQLILTPLVEFMQLIQKDNKTNLIILYIEPGGLYEAEAIQWMKESKFSIPVIVYVGGLVADDLNLSLGHAGAVVEGKGTSAKEKIELFDEYFGVPPFIPKKQLKADNVKRGIRVTSLHDIPAAARAIFNALKIDRDYRHNRPLKFNPWIKNMGVLGTKLPPSLTVPEGKAPMPYRKQLEDFHKNQLGKTPARQNMRKASHASANDGKVPRLYGHSLLDEMKSCSFSDSLILAWTGFHPAEKFESDLIEMLLIASLTNGPGTISAQGAKLSASAGNPPNAAMIATLASIGSVHGGNGAKAAELMIKTFRGSDITNPYSSKAVAKARELAKKKTAELAKIKLIAKEADIEFERIPCLGHPVYRNDIINYDPRERIIAQYLQKHKIHHAFFEFYHQMAITSRDLGITRNVLAVNVDAAIACVWMGICWPLLCNNKISIDRVKDIPFLSFALGRTAGAAGEYLDHRDYGTPMDMRIPASECASLTFEK